MQKIIFKNQTNTWYPRIIREFEDDQDEKPMFYFERGDYS